MERNSVAGKWPLLQLNYWKGATSFRYFLGLLVLGWSCPAGAQKKATLTFETAVHYATLYRHTPKLTIQTGQRVWGQEFSLNFQTLGRQPWQAWQRYPVLGVSLAHFHLGAAAHGDVWGLLPYLNVPVLRRPHWLLYFRVGTGLGYVAHPYDYFNNPNQNALGSHANNITQFRLAAEYRLNAHWRLQAGGAFSHFSNGASALPNYGVNLPAFFTALNWSPRGIRATDFVPAPASRRSGRHWGGLLSGGLALIEYAVIDGPRYPVWSLSAASYYQFNQVNRLLLGAEYEYNQAVYNFGLRTTNFKTQAEARRGATRLALTLADEFLFGPLGVQVQAGYYTGRRINQLVSDRWYSKLTVRYYLPEMLHTRLRCHVGISLKAHRTTAEFIAFNFGLGI